MARTTVAEVDKRLSAHEARCDQRWKENYRRLDSIENGISSINKTIRNGLIFTITVFLGITGFFIQQNFF
tara:strand:- start:6833 stop:7042 length:210 start_codon:yes stop_codon:yes gene_type:complete